MVNMHGFPLRSWGATRSYVSGAGRWCRVTEREAEVSRLRVQLYEALAALEKERLAFANLEEMWNEATGRAEAAEAELSRTRGSLDRLNDLLSERARKPVGK